MCNESMVQEKKGGVDTTSGHTQFKIDIYRQNEMNVVRASQWHQDTSAAVSPKAGVIKDDGAAPAVGTW